MGKHEDGPTLTEEQIRRQDFVDNEIFALMEWLAPPGKKIDWDIELIAEVREAARGALVERLGLTDEMSFYPYLEE